MILNVKKTNCINIVILSGELFYNTFYQMFKCFGSNIHWIAFVAQSLNNGFDLSCFQCQLSPSESESNFEDKNENQKSSHLWTLDNVRDPSVILLQKMDASELSVPEGWMVEKGEQGIEVFLSPDGTSLPSRRFEKFYVTISTLLCDGQLEQSKTMDHLSKLKCTIQLVPILETRLI